MKKILSVLFACLILTVNLNAEDLTPSDTYYKENIAVNNINSNSPSTRDPGDDPDPSGPGGNENGNGTWDGGNPSPVGDAVLPISLIAIAYGIFLVYRNRKTARN